MSSPGPEDEVDDYYVREAAEAAAKQPDQTSIQPEEIVLDMHDDGIVGQNLLPGGWLNEEEKKFHKDAAYDQCAEHCLAKGCSCFTVEIEDLYFGQPMCYLYKDVGEYTETEYNEPDFSQCYSYGCWYNYYSQNEPYIKSYNVRNRFSARATANSMLGEFGADQPVFNAPSTIEQTKSEHNGQVGHPGTGYQRTGHGADICHRQPLMEVTAKAEAAASSKAAATSAFRVQL